MYLTYFQQDGPGLAVGGSDMKQNKKFSPRNSPKLAEFVL